MLPEKLLEVLKHEGVVSITTWANNEAHVTNTWNSYLKVDGDNLWVPAAGLTSNRVLILHVQSAKQLL